MEQVARNLTDTESGALYGQRYVLHDRDTKFCAGFRYMLRGAGVEPLKLPPSSPDLNAFAERWVRSVKEECLSKLILFGETSLRRSLKEYITHFHTERPHQGKGNILLFPEQSELGGPGNRVRCKQRLGGLLRYYARDTPSRQRGAAAVTITGIRSSAAWVRVAANRAAITAHRRPTCSRRCSQGTFVCQ
jgi:putative transposase